MKLRDYLNLCESYELYEAKADEGLSREEKERVRAERHGNDRMGRKWKKEGRRGLKKVPSSMTTTDRLGNPIRKWYGKQQNRGLDVREELEAVLGYLLDEGFADSYETAAVIYENMSDEWLDEILGEAKVDIMVDKKLKKAGVDPVTRMATKMSARKRRKQPQYTPKTKTQVKLAHRRHEISERDPYEDM